MLKRPVALLLPLIFGACSLFKPDSTVPLGPLPEFEKKLAVLDAWESGVGDGVQQRYLAIYPRLYEDRIYATDEQGHVNAFDVDKGKRLWQASVRAPITAGVGGGETVLAVGTEEGELIALSPKDGHEVWRKQLSSEVVAIAESTKSIVAVRTLDGKLIGLDPTSGELLWQHARKTPTLNLKGASRPVVSGAKVIAGMDNGKLIAVSAARGKLLWETGVAVPKGRSELERMVDIDGDIQEVEGVVYVASFQGEIAAVSVSDGRVLWVRDFSSYSGLDVDNERLYVTNADGEIWAFDRRTGGALWKQDKLKTRHATRPTVVGPYVLVGDAEGYVHWMSASDGRFVARQRIGSANLVTAPVASGVRAYALSSSGTLAALEFVPKLSIVR